MLEKMLGIMSVFIFKLALLLFLCPITLQQSLPPKAVNPERIKLLRDALSWMTFKKNGQLASDQDLEEMFEALKDRYLNSRFYKTLIIAFSRGVLPKLTLKENSACAPAYTLEYKDSLNNSVTDGQLKKFIISSYDKRGEANRQFCDYREGLVCNQKTSKCECPEGTKMETISQGVGRCLLQEKEVCNLIDLDHDPNSKYEALKKHLPEMVLNLERPLSCNMGTQCRFKPNDQITPRCYPVNNGPWDKGQWDIDLGEECTLGLYGDTGQCRKKPPNGPDTISTFFNGYTCFDFGARSKPKSSRVGICTHDSGSYGISGARHGSLYDVQMISFVSPATTPFRGKRLHDYYLAYTKKLFTKLTVRSWHRDNATAIVYSAGRRCNIKNSEKIFELWKWFKSLEDTPPSGKDYLASEADLDKKFQEAEDLTVDLKIKMCQYRTEYATSNALRCVRNSTDSAGNDGRCEEIPESEDVTFSWGKMLYDYQQHLATTNKDLESEDRNYRKDIYEPDLECDPRLGLPPGSENAPPSTDSFPLEGGYCPPDRGCYTEYGLSIYQYRNCSIKDNIPKLWRICQYLGDDRRYHSNCERDHLDRLFTNELNSLTSFGGLQRGAACQYDIEIKLRNWIKEGGNGEGNKYKRLIELDKFKNEVGGKTLCDRTRLLECSQKSGTCECLPNTQPREATLEGGTTYFSDYCYVASGDCYTRYSGGLSSIYSRTSGFEKDELNRHYSAREDEVWDCTGSNWCVFTIAQTYYVDCTTENTGSTGYLGEEAVTTTTTTESNEIYITIPPIFLTTDKDETELMCVSDKCGWQDAGQTQKEFHVVLKTVTLIKFLAIIVYA